MSPINISVGCPLLWTVHALPQVSSEPGRSLAGLNGRVSAVDLLITATPGWVLSTRSRTRTARSNVTLRKLQNSINETCNTPFHHDYVTS